MNTSHNTLMAACLFMLLSSTAFSQSSGIVWKDGNVLTANQMQRLDNSKMNISSIGKPGFTPKLNAQGKITNPIVGDVSGATATSDGKTVSQIGQMAEGSVQKADVNQPNGVAGLDANGNVTAPLLNNSRVGGSDAGTDVSAALVNSISVGDSLGACTSPDKTVFIGGNNNLSAYTDPSVVKNVLGVGRSNIYMSIFGLNNLINGVADGLNPAGSMEQAAKVLATFAGQGPGIMEEFYDKYATPSIAQSDWNDGNALSAINGPAVTASLGFSPTIMLMNATYSTDSSGFPYYTSKQVNLWNTAVSDITHTYPSVKYIYPFVRSDAAADWFNPNESLASVETLIKSAGGVALDLPAGYLINSNNRLSSVISQIQWANANGIVTIFYVSPYAANPPSGVIPQQAHDPDFLKNTKKIVSLLAANNALPSAWVVGNYSPIKTINGQVVTANPVGNDTDPVEASVATVGRWLAENAPTSLYVPIPYQSQSPKTAVPCPAVYSSNVASSHANKSLAGNQMGLGSMAYQDADNPQVQKITVTGVTAAPGGIIGTNTHLTIDGSTGTYGVEFGGISSSQFYTDFHSSLSANDYDARIIGTGGKDGIDGQGTLSILAKNVILPATSFSSVATAPKGITGAARHLVITPQATSYGVDIGDSISSLTYIDLHSSQSNNDYDARIEVTGGKDGNLGSGTLDMFASKIRFHGDTVLHSLSKGQILTLTGVSDGTVINDSTDHVPVVYENGSWYPLQLGAALSN